MHFKYRFRIFLFSSVLFGMQKEVVDGGVFLRRPNGIFCFFQDLPLAMQKEVVDGGVFLRQPIGILCFSQDFLMGDFRRCVSWKFFLSFFPVEFFF